MSLFASHIVTPRPLLLRDSLQSSNRDDTQYPSRVEDTRLLASNGQFRELAVQLRSLYNEVSDLERRLSSLAEIADHIERERALSTTGSFSLNG